MNTSAGKAGNLAAAMARRRAKRNLALLLLLPVLIVAWIPVLRGKKQPATTAVPITPTATGAPTAAETAPSPGGETDALTPAAVVVAATGGITRRLQRLITPFAPRWSVAAGDPFGSDAAPAKQPAPTLPTPPSAPELTLVRDARFLPSAVLISPSQPPLAIIGGRSHRQGDEIQGYRIVSIEERRVVFQRDGTTFAVSIPEPTLGQEQAR